MKNAIQPIEKRIKSLIKNSDSRLFRAVAKDILEQDDPQSYMEDVLQYGCQSGVVSMLIYYHDTHAFYDEHYTEIEDLRQTLEEEFGEPLNPQGDLKNWYAWLAYEEMAKQIDPPF